MGGVGHHGAARRVCRRHGFRTQSGKRTYRMKEGGRKKWGDSTPQNKKGLVIIKRIYSRNKSTKILMPR